MLPRTALEAAFGIRQPAGIAFDPDGNLYIARTWETTLLNILADSIPDDERILLIEDTAELNIRKSNLVRFEARRKQAGIPAVIVRDLLKAALRHRPDRIIG